MENNAQNTETNKQETPVLGKIVLTFDRTHTFQSGKNAGKRGFIYSVSGDQTALNQYVADKKADGFDAVRPSDKKITYFGTKLVPNGTELVKQTKGYWFPVNEKFEVLTAATKDYGYDLAKDLVDGKLNK